MVVPRGGIVAEDARGLGRLPPGGRAEADREFKFASGPNNI